MPTVSICIPTYNRPEFLRQAIDSCLRQSFPDFEIIICDNSQEDHSQAVAQGFHDPRIRYYKNESNVGPFQNLIRTIDRAHGRFIKLLMDDDLIKPRCLELMVAAMDRHPEVGIVMAPMELIDASSTRIFPRFYLFRRMEYRYRFQVGDGLVDRHTLVREFLTHDYPCCVPSGILIRKECFEKLGPLDPVADFAIDLEMCMRVAVHYDFYYIDEVLSSWRFLESCHTAILHQTGLNVGAFYYISKKILHLPEMAALFPVARRRQTLLRQSLLFCDARALLNGLAAVRNKNPRLLIKTLREIVREDPFPTNWIRLPFFMAREIWVSLFPRKRPPPG